jgi:hydroxymethylpyrimidine/phosphomethylpyrimidine kinase
MEQFRVDKGPFGRTFVTPLHGSGDALMLRGLTIAGSDSSGGAGIQADLKTFAALGVYGMSALTAVTAQNTTAVTSVLGLSPDLVEAQIRAVFEDIGVDCAKTGMLGSTAVVERVAALLAELKPRHLVVDPVMVAKSGARLLDPDAIGALRSRLLPLCTVVTPNLPEAEILVGYSIESAKEREQACRDLVALGAKACVLKGGHLEGPPIDLLFDGRDFAEYHSERIETRALHGTGCTYSAALAGLLGRGLELFQAVAGAKEFVTAAIKAAPGLGHGKGPVHHMHPFYFVCPQPPVGG